MNHTFQDLKKCIKEAIQQGSEFIGVLKVVPGCDEPETEINSNVNFIDKLSYYAKEFNEEDLKHRYMDGIRIVGFVHGKSYEELQEKLEAQKNV